MNAAGINGPCKKECFDDLWWLETIVIKSNVNFWDEKKTFIKVLSLKNILRIEKSTYRTVIKRRTTDCNGWKSRRLWTCCLHIAHTVGAIRTIHIYCWSWRICCWKTCSGVCLMWWCWWTIALCCSSLIIVHNCNDRGDQFISDVKSWWQRELKKLQFNFFRMLSSFFIKKDCWRQAYSSLNPTIDHHIKTFCLFFFIDRKLYYDSATEKQ